jgi:hypothetical protein
MNESKDLPDPGIKGINIIEAFNTLISMNKLRIPGSKRDEVMKMINEPKILPIYEDASRFGKPCGLVIR